MHKHIQDSVREQKGGEPERERKREMKEVITMRKVKYYINK